MGLTKRLYRLLDRQTKGRFTEAWVLLLLPLFAVTFAIDFSLRCVRIGIQDTNSTDPYFDPRDSFFYDPKDYW